MAITKDNGRQYELTARADFTFATIATGVAAEAIDLPAGATVTGGCVVVTTAFNSGTSDVVQVGMATSTFLAGTESLQAAVRYDFTSPSGTANGYTAVVDTVDITWTAVGTAATAGEGYLLVKYVIDGRANENQPS